MYFILIVLYAIFNHARGCRFWNLLPSTTMGRIVATLGMSLTSVAVTGQYKLLGLWPLLYLWSVPAWDMYWSAEIGHDTSHSKWWGCWHMALRMLYAIPAVLYTAYIMHGACWPIIFLPPLAIPYVVAGIYAGSYVITWAEYMVGALLGIIMAMVM